MRDRRLRRPFTPVTPNEPATSPAPLPSEYVADPSTMFRIHQLVVALRDELRVLARRHPDYCGAAVLDATARFEQLRTRAASALHEPARADLYGLVSSRPRTPTWRPYCSPRRNSRTISKASRRSSPTAMPVRSSSWPSARVPEDLDRLVGESARPITQRVFQPGQYR